MKDVKINISSIGFPSQFVSDSEKASDEFGLQIGQAIQYEWFKKDSNSCRFIINQEIFKDFVFMQEVNSLLLNIKMNFQLMEI